MNNGKWISIGEVCHGQETQDSNMKGTIGVPDFVVDQYLEPSGLKIRNLIVGTGACQFGSLARRSAIKFIESHPTMTEKPLESWKRSMEKPREWGDSVSLAACVNVFNLSIIMGQFSLDQWSHWSKFEPAPEVTNQYGPPKTCYMLNFTETQIQLNCEFTSNLTAKGGWNFETFREPGDPILVDLTGISPIQSQNQPSVEEIFEAICASNSGEWGKGKRSAKKRKLSTNSVQWTVHAGSGWFGVFAGFG